MAGNVHANAVLPKTPGAPSVDGRAGIGKHRDWRRNWLLAIAIVLGVVGAAAWTLRNQTSPVHYATQPVARGSVVRAVTATGTVNPELTIIVGSYVSGVIQQLSCDFNTKVKRGQVCAKIDPRPYQTVVDQDRANLANAKAQLDKDMAALAYARITSERYARLVKQDSASRDAADNAKNNYDQAAAQVELDHASIAQHQAALDAAPVNLDYTNISSPVDGTVVSRNVTMGQTVAASFQTPTLFLIATDLTKMQVDTNVSESDIGAVELGDSASFTVEAFPDRPFTGNVTQIRQAPQTIQNVVTYDVVVSVANNDLALMPGMTANTKVVAARRDNVIRIPDQALRYKPVGLRAGSGSAQVWVLRDNRPTAVALTLGLDDDSFSEVLSGDLKPGDMLILSEQGGSGGSGGSRPHFFGL
jgi:HlyD family secretion protein